MAVGGAPNTDDLALEKTAIRVDRNGQIPTGQDCRTAEPDVFGHR